METNTIPEDVRLDPQFLKFLAKLHYREFAAQKQISSFREIHLNTVRARPDNVPTYRPPSNATRNKWHAKIPTWMQDQRNQMTGPADNEKLVAKLMKSNSPGVMLDLEDSMANQPDNLFRGYENIKKALTGKFGRSKCTVTFVRVRGLHMQQIFPGLVRTTQITSASLFDLAMLFYDMDLDTLTHDPCIYIPKSEGANEAKWWARVFSQIERLKKWSKGTIKCMALVESHPLAYEMEEFAFNLQPYLVGLNLGRWDYMASLIDHMYYKTDWKFPDRNSIPSDIPFFQELRKHMVNVCHKHKMLAIGGMSALYPSRKDAELNEMAQEKLKVDKDNEATMFMDGAWTGHPDQNDIATHAFPCPNQLDKVHGEVGAPDLREPPKGPITDEGTIEAIRVCTQYRQGVLEGRGASLINGYMEDLATDRIYRIMICQRIDRGIHSEGQVKAMFDEVLGELGSEYVGGANATLKLIVNKQFNPK